MYMSTVTLSKTQPTVFSDWGQLGGSGSIMSNTLDMARWLKLQLNLGVSAEGQEVVPQEVVEETHKPVNVIEMKDSVKVYGRPNAPVTFTYPKYGMGWRSGSS